MRKLIAGVIAALLMVGGAAAAESPDMWGCSARNEVESCSDWIRLAPPESRDQAYQARGDVYAAKGEYDRAIADFTEAIRIKKDPAHYAARGRAYEKKGQYDLAIADFDAANRSAKKPTDYLADRAHAYRLKGDLARAVADYTASIDAEKSDAAYLGRGIAYSLRGALDLAIADYDMAAALDLKWFSLGASDKADFQHVIADYDKLIAREPRNAVAFHGRGWAHFKIEEYDLAVSDFSEAIRIDPKFVMAYVSRGIAYREKGDARRAVADFDAALARPATDPSGQQSQAVAQMVRRILKGSETASPVPLGPMYGQALPSLIGPASQAPQRPPSNGPNAASIPLDELVPKPPTTRPAAIQAFDQLLKESEAASSRPAVPPPAPPSPPAAPQPAPQVAALPPAPPSSDAASVVDTNLDEPVACRGTTNRAAFLVGNQSYGGKINALDNPRRDIVAFTALLCANGFTVHRYVDLRLAAFDAAIKRFAAAARGAATVVVYYSGHGFALGQKNWLLPIDANLDCADIAANSVDEVTLKRSLVDLDADLMTKLDKVENQIVILDACRTDPIRGCRGSETLTLNKRLARVPPEGTRRLIVYATEYGRVALDAVKGSVNSPLMTALLRRLPENRQREWFAAMNAVADEVYGLTHGVQIPNMDVRLNPHGCLASSC